MKTTTDATSEIRARLEGELRQVVGRLRSLGAQVAREIEDAVVGTGSNPLDTFDNAEFHIARESLFASRERLSERAQQLAAAVARAHDGTYGTCVECGNPIGAARLRAIPEVATCITCQERLDRYRPLGSGYRAASVIARDEDGSEPSLDEAPRALREPRDDMAEAGVAAPGPSQPARRRRPPTGPPTRRRAA
jgi:DnaK suppressor protein